MRSRLRQGVACVRGGLITRQVIISSCVQPPFIYNLFCCETKNVIARDFIATTASVNFNGKHALEMFHRLHTLDYGSRRAGSKAADVRDMFIPIFHLDYFSMVGQPLKPITQHSDRFFDNVTVTFEHWHAPYKAKHQDLPFELDHRTFRLAKAAT